MFRCYSPSRGSPWLLTRAVTHTDRRQKQKYWSIASVSRLRSLMTSWWNEKFSFAVRNVLVPVWMTLTFTKITVVWETKLLCSFPGKSQWIWIKIGLLPQPASFLMLMVILFLLIDIQGRELYVDDFKKCVFNIYLHVYAYMPISLKLGMMIDITKLYSWIPVWMTLTMVTSVLGIWNLFNHSVVKVAWSHLNFGDGWLCMGDDW